MHIAIESPKGIRFEGAGFQVLYIRRLSTKMSSIADTADKKLKTVNAMEAIDVSLIKSLGSCELVWPVMLLIPVSVMMTDISGVRTSADFSVRLEQNA
jgi:hypothetical protein